MGPADRVQLTLAIDSASDPITGALGDGHDKSVEFSGWLGFAAALEELLSAPGRNAAAQRLGEVSPKQP